MGAMLLLAEALLLLLPLLFHPSPLGEGRVRVPLFLLLLLFHPSPLGEGRVRVPLSLLSLLPSAPKGREDPSRG